MPGVLFPLIKRYGLNQARLKPFETPLNRYQYRRFMPLPDYQIPFPSPSDFAPFNFRRAPVPALAS
jgi:hypothetical protein